MERNYKNLWKRHWWKVQETNQQLPRRSCQGLRQWMGDLDLGGDDCCGLQGGRERGKGGEGWDLGDWESRTWEVMRTGTAIAGCKLAMRDFSVLGLW